MIFKQANLLVRCNSPQSAIPFVMFPALIFVRLVWVIAQLFNVLQFSGI